MPLKKRSFFLILTLNFILLIYQTYPHHKFFSEYFNHITINWLLISSIYFTFHYSSPNTIFIAFSTGLLIDIVNQEYLGSLYFFIFRTLLNYCLAQTIFILIYITYFHVISLFSVFGI